MSYRRTNEPTGKPLPGNPAGASGAGDLEVHCDFCMFEKWYSDNYSPTDDSIKDFEDEFKSFLLDVFFAGMNYGRATGNAIKSAHL